MFGNVLNDTNKILNDKGGNSGSFRTNLVSFRTYRHTSPISLTSFLVGTFFAASYSKAALRAYCPSIYYISTVNRIRMKFWCHVGAICISVFGIFRGIIYLNCGFLIAPNWWIFGSIFFIICNVVLFIGLVKNRTDCIKIWLIFQGIIESVSSSIFFILGLTK